MSPPTWRDVLAEAQSALEVLAVAQDFLDRLEPFEVDLLPPRCRPRALHSVRELHEYAYELKSQHCEPASQQVVDRVAEVMAEATLRLTILFGSGSRPRLEPFDWSGIERLGGTAIPSENPPESA